MKVASKLTENEGRYIMFVYRKQHEELTQVKTTLLANAFGVRPATVTEMLQKLAYKGLLKYTRYHGIELTREGAAEARRLLRNHRLLEVLLARALNYDVQNACDRASELDVYVSDKLTDSICKNYGYPRICPCNKKIFLEEECMGSSREREDGR